MSANSNFADMASDADNHWQSSALASDDTNRLREEVGDSKRDVGRGILALVDQAVCSGTNFLTMAVLARSMSMEAFGVFSLAFLCFYYARAIQERTLAAPYLVFTHRPDHDSRTLLGSNLVHQAIFAFCTLAVALAAGAAFVYFGRQPDLGYALIALSLAVPFLLLRDQLRSVCLAHFRMKVVLCLDIAVAVLQLGSIGILILTSCVTVPSTMAVLGFSCLIPAFFWYRIRPLEFSVDRQQLVTHWKTFWDFSRWLVVGRAFGMGGQYAVPAMVALYLDAASVGAFASCTALAGLSLMFIQGLNNFFQPRTVVAYQRHGSVGMLRAVLQTAACFTICLCGPTLLFFFFGDRLLGFIYGAPYASYGRVAATLSLAMLTLSVSFAFQGGLAALGKPRGFLAGELSYCAAAVGLAAVFIPRWELMGAATALVVAGCVVSLVTIATLFWLMNQDRERIPAEEQVEGQC